jgi:hypothetical protein
MTGLVIFTVVPGLAALALNAWLFVLMTQVTAEAIGAHDRNHGSHPVQAGGNVA